MSSTPNPTHPVTHTHRPHRPPTRAHATPCYQHTPHFATTHPAWRAGPAPRGQQATGGACARGGRVPQRAAYRGPARAGALPAPPACYPLRRRLPHWWALYPCFEGACACWRVRVGAAVAFLTGECGGPVSAGMASAGARGARFPNSGVLGVGKGSLVTSCISSIRAGCSGHPPDCLPACLCCCSSQAPCHLQRAKELAPAAPLPLQCAWCRSPLCCPASAC